MPVKKIYVISDEGVTPCSLVPFVNETHLMDLLSSSVQFLCGELLDPICPRRWIAVGREFPLLSSGSNEGAKRPDWLLLDQDGVPTIVEAKIVRGTESVRKLVGQGIHYAALLNRSIDANELRRHVARRAAATNLTVEGYLGPVLTSSVSKEEYWKKVQANLDARRTRLILAVDKPHRELLTILNYFSVSAQGLELAVLYVSGYAANRGETLVYTELLCGPDQAPVRKSSIIDQRLCDFLTAFQTSRTEREMKVISSLLEWAKGREYEVAISNHKVPGERHLAVYRQFRKSRKAVFQVRRNGYVRLSFFDYFDIFSRSGPNLQRTFSGRLGNLGFTVPSPRSLETMGEGPNTARIDILQLAEEERLRGFLDLLSEVAERPSVSKGRSSSSD